jgi:chromodomain-helicase-DNA-binding protein 1
MSSPPSDASPVNGHSSPLVDGEHTVVANGTKSDSELSDVQVPDADAPSPESPVAEEVTFVNPELTVEEPSESSDGDASADADFDMDDSPQSPQSEQDEDDEPSPSNASRQPQKRKAPNAAEEDYMRENPELYGLRRSVRALLLPHLSEDCHRSCSHLEYSLVLSHGAKW